MYESECTRAPSTPLPPMHYVAAYRNGTSNASSVTAMCAALIGTPGSQTRVSSLCSAPPRRPQWGLGEKTRTKNRPEFRELAKTGGGADGIRTRDLRRDRPAF